MNYFVTRSNFIRIISNLDLNIPYGSRKKYYHNVRLKHFDLDMNLLSYKQAELLTISNKLYLDIASINRDFLLNIQKQEQKNWIYKLGMPSYHCDKGCFSLNSLFSNVQIPNYLSEEMSNAYRKYYLENIGNFGREEGKRDPRIFARNLKNEFSLEEDVGEIEKKYLNLTILDNSGVENVEKELSKEENIDLINHRIVEFVNQLNAIPKEYQQYSFTLIRNGNLSEEERKKCAEVFYARRDLVGLIISFHFNEIMKQGLDVSQKFLEMMGLKSCTHCCKNEEN